jgi:hypothetical protein
MKEVNNVILERTTHEEVEYCAVTEYNGCSGCTLEEDTLEGCQKTIGYPLAKGSFRSYCNADYNPHGVSIVWIKTEEVPNYLATAVIYRMTQPD